MESYSNLSEGQLSFLISSCLSLELYEEAYEFSKELQVTNKSRLNENQRNLYMRSMKGKLNVERNAWKILMDFENYEGNKELLPRKLLEEKKNFLEEEIKKLCVEVTENCEVLESNLTPNEYEAKIFYLKLKADYLRYLGEITSEEDFKNYKEICKSFYDEAYELCQKKLQPTSPLFLSVALNYSVFLYTLNDNLLEAYNKANDVYKLAMLKLVPEQKIPEVENILKSLEENLTIWRIELAENNGKN